MKKHWNPALKKYVLLGELAEVAQKQAQRQDNLTAALADLRPDTVSLDHFLKRNLNQKIAAGECIVTVKAKSAGCVDLTVVHVEPAGDHCRVPMVVTREGFQQSGLGATFSVTWTDRPVHNLYWLFALAAFTAQSVDRFWYRPSEAAYVCDSDYVVAVDDEWIMVCRLNSLRLIHVSQLDEPINRRNDPDRHFENWAWNDHAAGYGDVKPSMVI